jgi:hypothetical protein
MKRRQHPLAIVTLSLAASTAAFAEEDIAFFENKIRPVLAEKCYSCHSAKADKLKAGLQVDHREHLLGGGDTGPALVPGKPDDSLLIETIRYGNPDMQMPPKGKLPAAVIADFEKWIALGAPWPDEPKPVRTTSAVKVDGSEQMVQAFDLQKRKASHWAWKPIVRPALPAVKLAEWPKSNIDRFILAKLEAAGLRPAEEAAPETWLRRVYFDLIGLPPTPVELTAFLQAVAQTGPDKAYAAEVEKLLASPHYGERWARHWMDLARYGETCGHEFDYPIPNAFRYRDYLIDAYNRDVPHDQFLLEHLAGDLLEKPRLDPATGVNQSIQATGFWYLHEAIHAPTDIRGDEAGRIDNQIDVFAKSFLGLTLACARCHDHKFDAIGTADYYAIAGYLQSSRRQDAFLDPGGKVAAAAAKAREIQARGQALLKDAFPRATADQFARHLIAADRLIAEDAKQPQKDTTGSAFADFENGYGGWQIEGDAFGSQPATGTFPGQQKVSGFLGRGLVNTWNGSDGKKGRALSPEFTIEHPFLHFLIGGGGHTGETCVNLVIDGRAVLSATGANNEKLDPRTWDLTAHRGKKARLEIVDQARGSWGHVNVDHFAFSDSKEFDPAATPHPIDPALVKRIAMEQGLISDQTLLHWVSLLRGKAAEDPRHPLHAWKSGAKPAASEPARASGKVLADFENGDAQGWTATGFSFDAKPSAVPAWAPGSGSLLSPAGVLTTMGRGAKFSGVLRSPTFELTQTKIHLRMNARAAKVRLVIDGHHMNHYHQLLLRGSILKPNETDTGGEFRWLTMQGNLDKYLGHRVYLEISDLDGGYVAVDQVLLSEESPPADPAPVAKKAASREELARSIGEAFAGGDPALLNLAWRENLLPRNPELMALQAEMDALAVPEPEFAVAMLDGTPEDESIHIRGSHLKLGAVVPRRNLAALGGQAAPANASGRLELARLMVAPDNPLVTRVAVNRVWHHLFDRGLVPTVDDFGAMGQEPSHPELLDWLAAEFSTELGWSLKRLLAEIVLSRTYRMSSAPHPALDRARLAGVDPDNVLLHRAPVRRLQAEAIRDSILAASGRLDPKIGGPSVPVHLTAFMEGRGRPGGGPLDGAGRRSLYTEIRRNFLPPLLLTFDMPIPFNAMGRRSVSNVPAQALTLMNDPFVVEQAKLWAEKIGGDTARDDAAKVGDLFLTAFGRPPTAEERRQVESYLASEPDRQQAWTDLCHALFNKKEFIFLN